MNSSLSLQALRYGHRQPLFAPLTLACRPGEIWAVLGANGRGKSTLHDMIWMEKIVGEHTLNPPKVIPFSLLDYFN